MNSDERYDFVYIEDRENEKRLCKDFLENNIESESICRTICHKTNEIRWVKHTRNLIKDSEGNIISYIATLQDIDNLKKMEMEIYESKRKLEKAYVYKSSFLANMSHEIRTPLNGILGMLTLLEDTDLSNEQKEYINMIKECSSNLMTIINDILDYSKLDAGKMNLDLKPFNFRNLIDSINDILISKIYENKLQYTFNINENIEEYFIGDSNRIKQVLLNLLSNSTKFTDSNGKIHLSITKLSRNNKTVDLLFSVKDTGCGISEDDRDRIFESFSQIENYNKVYQGTGLGLAIAKSLVSLMKGQIWLNYSELNRGSEFCFSIPLEITENKDENINSFSILSNLDVLIIDDNLQNRIYLSGLCHKWGMTPHPFGYPQEALLFTKKKKYDLGLIDICMPTFDGIKFAEEFISQNEHNKNVPLIALSSIGDKIKSLDKFFSYHMIKPISENKLKKECLSIISKVNSKSNQKHYQDSNIQKSIDLNLFKSIQILVAEDNYTNQKVILGLLHKIGFFNVYLVENGVDCLKFLKTNKIDLCFIDIKMPLLNGVDLLFEIKHSTDLINMPYCIALTAYSLKNDREKYLQLGFNDYISKPIDFALLYNSIYNFCNKLDLKSI